MLNSPSVVVPGKQVISEYAVQWHISGMRDRSTTSRLQRLEQLKSLLASREHVTAAELAAALRVSLRTLNRDLALLRDGGMPIESDRGRGGGLRLHRQWSIGRVNLHYREAIDTLLSLAIAEKLGSPLFLERAAAARNKLAATFSASHRERIRMLRRRILVGEVASPQVLANYDPTRARGCGAVTEAFFEMKQLQITYLDGRGRTTKREVEPHFLYLSWPVWYLLAWDRLREDVRTFRIDRIVHAGIRPTGFRLRSEAQFLAAVENSGAPL
jgi:predicted DNA-binding transcriptional regulator YafY